MLWNLLYVLIGFIYAVQFYNFGTAFMGRFGEANIPMDPSCLIWWGIHLLLPALIIGIVEKIKVLMQYDEEISASGLLMESVSLMIPALIKGFVFAIVICLLNLAARAAYFPDILDQVSASWPFQICYRP